MGWLDNWSANRELSKARKEMMKARSPWSISGFVDKAIELGKIPEALEEVEAANKEFPSSECLQQAYRSLIKRQCEEDIRGHRESLRSSPSGVVYYELARLYKQSGDYDQAIDLARKGTRLYPDFEGNYIVLGDIRYERFQRDLRATDGELAIELLEKASDLNRENYRLLRKLAEIYLAIGAKDSALEKLNEILSFAPDDSAALKLLGQAHKLKAPKKGGLKEILKDFERRAELHSKVKTQNIGPRGQRFLRNPDELKRKLKEFGMRIDGFQRALVLSPQGKLLAAEPHSSELQNSVGQLSEFFEAALHCSLRMDISTFEKGLFESNRGLSLLLVFDRLQMAVFVGSSVKPAQLQSEVLKFLEHDLYV